MAEQVADQQATWRQARPAGRIELLRVQSSGPCIRPEAIEIGRSPRELPAGEPAWSGDLDEAVPVLSLHRWLGLPEMVYLAGLQRYLLFTWRLHQDFSPTAGTDLLILESPEPWGPFSLVHFEEHWEGREFNPYCPRLPLKWMDADGITGWLQFSGSWGPDGQKRGVYRSHVRPFRLRLR